MLRWAFFVMACAAACGKKSAPPADAPPAAKPPPVKPVDAAVAAIDAAGPPPAPAGKTSKVLQVAMRAGATCARRADGRVRCWGRGKAVPAEVPGITTAVSVDISASGEIHVVTADGHVVRSTGEPVDAPPDAIDVRFLGDTPLVLTRGGDLTTSPKQTTVNAVRIEDTHAVALYQDGHVSMLGGGRPIVVAKDIDSLIGGGCARHRGGAVACWDGRGKPRKWTGPANILERVTADHVTCDRTSSGVACTGWNDVGQLGTGRGPDRASPVLVDLKGKPVALAAADRSACAVLDSGELACWGANDAGQLGDGTRRDRAQPILVPGVTSDAPFPPSDGLKDIEQSSDGMSWMDLPATCKRPTQIAGLLDKIETAYAYTSKTGADIVIADFRLHPEGYRGAIARTGQHAIELRLSGGLARGRYRDTGSKRAALFLHDETGVKPGPKKVDLVIESVDKDWACGQLLDPDPAKRQAFAARISPRLY